MITMGQGFSPFLRGSVRLKWMVGFGRFRGRQWGIGTINAGSRRQDEFWYVALAAELQQVQCPRHIGVNIDPWIFHGLAHPGPCSQVDHGIKGLFNEHRSRTTNSLTVSNVDFTESKTGT